VQLSQSGASQARAVRKAKLRLRRLPAALALSSVLAGACGSSHNGSVQSVDTGQACQVASDCYSGIDAGSLLGAPICLTQVPNGYCTHGCTADTDCCAAPGECPQALAEVCGPFESTGEMDCFLSCAADVVGKAGFSDDTAFCQKYGNAAFICRSTGGGSTNRKVCVPNG
jgi:hypothetical protein